MISFSFSFKSRFPYPNYFIVSEKLYQKNSTHNNKRVMLNERSNMLDLIQNAWIMTVSRKSLIKSFYLSPGVGVELIINLKAFRKIVFTGLMKVTKRVTFYYF
jgi:hypothetical protein